MSAAELTTEGAREQRLAATFVELADTMVDDFDVADFLHLLVERVAEVLDASEVGLMLADAAGRLHVMAASNERTHLLELFQLQNEEGPCLDCFRNGRPVASDDLEADRERWPDFVPAALDAGFRSVQALPMRVRAQVLGALNVFGADVGALTEADQAIGQAMADVATIGLLQERSVRDSQLTAEQLQIALDSRIVIEQAKGVLAEQATLDMGDAFARLRTYARNHNRRLSEVAREVVDGSRTAQSLLADARAETTR